MTDGQRAKIRGAMQITAEAGIRSSQQGTRMDTTQAVVYNTMFLTMHWLMSVVGEEPENELTKRFEQLLSDIRSYGIIEVPDRN